LRLKDKVAVITGAGGPMGQTIALRFAEEGANLLITDISERRLNETKQKLLEKTDNNKVLAVRANALVLEELKEIEELVKHEFQKADILINVVGGIRDQSLTRSILEIEEERWDQTMALNLKGCLNFTKIMAPMMLKNKYGKIVNISSIHFEGADGYSDYGAAKAGVASFTKTAAKEFSPHINVNCIAPGLIQTSVVQRMDNEILEEYRKQTLLGRLGRPIDIANAALFLSSDESSYITGHIMPVSGGVWPHL